MLLKLTTTTLAAFLIWVPVAQAWTWPVQGPVLQPFVYDPAHPYAAGQHRGIDIGATTTGEPVVAPAAGTVSFAGYVPTSGESLTIETADGYSVTLTHLGSLAVPVGAAVTEGETVATVGPSGTPEQSVPYVHLGIRLTADQFGYLDPLGLLPAAPDPTPVPTPTPSPTPAPVPAKPSAPAHARGGGLVIEKPAAPAPASRVTPRPARPAHVPKPEPAPASHSARTPEPQFRLPLVGSIPGVPRVAPSQVEPVAAPIAFPVVAAAFTAVLALAIGVLILLFRRRRAQKPAETALV